MGRNLKTFTNTEALRALANGKTLMSICTEEVFQIKLTKDGIIQDKRGIKLDWNEIATSFKDSWIIID